MEKIDWSVFETSKYVKFEEGVPTELELTDWQNALDARGGVEKPGLRFRVLSENKVALEPSKELMVSNYTFIKTIKPILERAEAIGAANVRVIVSRSGIGKATKYLVVEAP